MTMTWKPGGGKAVPITELTTKHLENIVRNLKRNLKLGVYSADAQDTSSWDSPYNSGDDEYDFAFGGFNHEPSVRDKIKGIEKEIESRRNDSSFTNLQQLREDVISAALASDGINFPPALKKAVDALRSHAAQPVV